MSDDEKEYEFDIALSFAGEDRALAEALANGLRDAGVRVFYDRYEQVQLWGKDLYQHLQGVYRDHAQYCIIFVSQHYARKLWPRHELRQAQARAFQESREYILPLRLDDSELPGLNATTGYIDLRNNALDAVQAMVIRKVFGEETDAVGPDELSWRGELVEFRGDEVASFWPKKLERAQKKTTYTIMKDVPRIKYGDEPDFGDREGRVCHDCSAIPGEYHVPGCDMERCPLCGEQAIGCNCIAEDPW